MNAGLEKSMLTLMRGAYLTMHRYMRARCLRAAGITVDQYVFLLLLGQNEGISQKGLAQRASADANTTTSILRRLEKRGLVRRCGDPRDKRIIRVTLTAKGRSITHLADSGHNARDLRLYDLMDPRKHPAVGRWLEDVLLTISDETRQS
jgi:DNA-binding MarR family transcriptional regulator